MAGPMEEKWSIDKLDGTNWTTWKFQMHHLLLAKGLWGHVEGTEVLEEGAGDRVQGEYRQKSLKVFSTIVMAISTSQLYLIMSCDNPKEAWDTLRNHFERDTLVNKLFLKEQYISSILRKYGLSNATTVSTPADISVKLEKDDGQSKEVSASKYQSMVGSLLYAAMATRPDIAQAVGVVSKFNSKPTEAHQTAVKRILRYLKGTMNLALLYTKSEDGAMVGYSDSDWAGDPDDRHSTSGNLFLMAGAAVSWLSKKQSVVALSTSEAEYVALSLATQEAVWLRKLLADLGGEPSVPTKLMEDNQGAIAIARNLIADETYRHSVPLGS